MRGVQFVDLLTEPRKFFGDHVVVHTSLTLASLLSGQPRCSQLNTVTRVTPSSAASASCVSPARIRRWATGDSDAIRLLCPFLLPRFMLRNRIDGVNQRADHGKLNKGVSLCRQQGGV